MLVQNWSTLRFSDHRGVSPSTVNVTGSAFSAELTRPKTVGADKSNWFAPVDDCFVLLFRLADVDPSWFQSAATARTVPS